MKRNNGKYRRLLKAYKSFPMWFHGKAPPWLKQAQDAQKALRDYECILEIREKERRTSIFSEIGKTWGSMLQEVSQQPGVMRRFLMSKQRQPGDGNVYLQVHYDFEKLPYQYTQSKIRQQKPKKQHNKRKYPKRLTKMWEKLNETSRNF